MRQPDPAYLIPVIVAVLFGICVALLAPARTVWLDVGAPGDDAYVEGFHVPEVNDRESFRWSKGDARLTLPVPGAGLYSVELAIAVIEPAGRLLEISCGDSTVPVREEGGQGNRTVTFECRTSGDNLIIDLAVPAITLSEGDRALGVSVRDVRADTSRSAMGTLSGPWFALVVAGSLLAAWIGAGAVGMRAFRWGVPVAIVAGWLLLMLIRPAWLGTTSAGPGSLLALIGATVALALASGYPARARSLAALAPLAVLVVEQRAPALLLPTRWTAGDAGALRWLPWLAAGTILIAASRGTRADRFLAATGAALGLTLVGLPVATKLAGERWALTIMVPDWTDRASVAGAVYLAAIGLVIVVGIITSRRDSVWPVIAVLGLALVSLTAWRAAVMNFNGDEPHYYVTARSLASDGDLELLNNYHEDSYRQTTISPDGNIAVQRDAGADRYSTLPSPASADGTSIHLPLRVQGHNGSAEWIPLLTPAPAVTIPLSGSCAVSNVTVVAPDRGERDLMLRLRDASGAVVWERQHEIAGTEAVAVEGVCGGDAASLTVESRGGLIAAYVVDERAGLVVLPGRMADDAVTFGSLPRDRYASRNAITELTIYNPGPDTVDAVVVLVGEVPDDVAEIGVEVQPGSTQQLHLRSGGYESLRVESSDQLVIGAVGRVWAGAYTLPERQRLSEWSLVVHPDGRYDSGIWLSLANDGSAGAEVSINDDGIERLLVLCPECAETVLLEAGDRERPVSVSVLSGEVSASAIEYQERTGSLHFDPGLPLLAAPFARFGNPMAALAAPFLAALAMLPGLALLLRRVGVRGRVVHASIAGVVLLAPVSAYSVRLYTEIIAACLLVWALVCWEASFRRPRLLLALPAIALALPVLHGRYVVFSVAFGFIAVLRVVSLLPQMNRRTLAGMAGALILVGVLAMAVLQVAVGLRERVTASYIATNWADVSLMGVLLDRGSGLIPFAPWVLLALFVPRPLRPLQRVALGVVLLEVAAVIVRAGGWQTWGAPARYLLPAVPLLALLVAPAVQRLWERRTARPALAAVATWSVAMTYMLHWLPLSGYVLERRYLVDEAWRGTLGISPLEVFPMIAPRPGSFVVGTAIVVGLLACSAWLLVASGTHPLEHPRRGETPHRGVSTTDG